MSVILDIDESIYNLSHGPKLIWQVSLVTIWRTSTAFVVSRRSWLRENGERVDRKGTRAFVRWNIEPIMVYMVRVSVA